ncbi:MAG: hypothetical protein J6333_09480 [Planctomycetes bacterium]|nr:hypothetical protein [Planctomycetota bacterium]
MQILALTRDTGLMTTKKSHTKQFLFFLMPEETIHVIERLCEKNDIVVLHTRSSTNSPTIIDSFDDVGKVYLCPKNELTHIVMDKIDEHAFFVNIFVSPVVEFDSSILRENELSRGRIYFRGGYDGRDGWVAFPENTASIYKHMVGYLKSTLLTKNREFDGYISKKTMIYLASGGRLSQF